MKRNLDLIIILTLSVLVCGVLYLLYDNTNEFSVPKNGNITMSRGGGSRIIPRGSVNGGTWAPEGISGGLSSSRSVRVSPQTYRRNSMQATSSNGSLISSSRSLMSNRTANTVSIVGGNNASFGRTAEANMSQPLAYSGGAGYPSVNVPSMRSANPVVAAAPAYVGVDAGAMSAPYQSFPTVSAPNYGVGNLGTSILGGVSYDQTATASPLRAGGQLRAPGTMGNSWGNWLDGSGYGEDRDKNEDGKIEIDKADAEEIWKDMMDNKGETDETNSWNEGMGQGATWDSFLAWLEKNGGTSKYEYVPVGDIAPLFLLAFAYLAMLLFRRRIN